MAACIHRREMGLGHTAWGAATPWLAHLAITFARWASGWAWAPPTVVLGPSLACRWALPFILFAHFCFTLSVLRLLLGFPLVFKYLSCKTFFSNTSETRSIVKAYMSKDCLFLPFWTLFGGQIRSIVTANKSPKLNLCSSRANS